MFALRPSLLLASTLLLVACPQSASIIAPEGRLHEPAALERMMAEVNQRRLSVSAEARVSYYGEEGARKAKSVILAKRPAALHFSVYSPTDDMLAVLASDGERFTFFERGQSTCYGGKSCAENIGRFSFFPLEGAELVNALMGGVPFISAATSTLEWDTNVGAYLLERTSGAGRIQRIWVAHGTWLVQRMELLTGGKLELSIVFKDVAMVSGEALAHTLDMKMPGRDIDLRVRLREVELNTTLDDTPFRIPCPDGSSEQRLMCYAGEPTPQDSKPETGPDPGKDADHGS